MTGVPSLNVAFWRRWNVALESPTFRTTRSPNVRCVVGREIMGMGDGGEELHTWIFAEGGPTGRDGAAVEGPQEMPAAAGSVVVGRRMFDLGEEPWGDPPPIHNNPVFVVTHRSHSPIVKQGGTTYTFVTDADGVTHLTFRLARGSEPAEERPYVPDEWDLVRPAQRAVVDSGGRGRRLAARSSRRDSFPLTSSTSPSPGRSPSSLVRPVVLGQKRPRQAAANAQQTADRTASVPESHATAEAIHERLLAGVPSRASDPYGAPVPNRCTVPLAAAPP